MSDAERQPVTGSSDAGQPAGDPAVDPSPARDPSPAQDPSAAASPPEEPGAATASPDDADAASEHADLVVLADGDPRSKVELLGELLAAEEKRDEYLDDLRRAHADFENYRKRVMREGTQQREAGRAEAVQALLEVLDDLERTIEAARSSEDEALARGVELVAAKLTQALGGLGLTRIDGADVPFDPTVHEAVAHLPAEQGGATPVVIEVLRPGYRIGERVLRPAMVAVKG